MTILRSYNLYDQAPEIYKMGADADISVTERIPLEIKRSFFSEESMFKEALEVSIQLFSRELKLYSHNQNIYILLARFVDLSHSIVEASCKTFVESKEFERMQIQFKGCLEAYLSKAQRSLINKNEVDVFLRFLYSLYPPCSTSILFS